MNLFIDNEHVLFETENQQSIMLNIGKQQIAKKYFKQALPSPYDVEMAIIEIEDQIMLIRSQWQPHKNVFTADLAIKEMMVWIGNPNELNRDGLERNFNRVVDVIAGSPKHENEFPQSAEFISLLLILRELTHHLDIETIAYKSVDN